MINLDQVEKILSLADQGLSQRKIAHCLGISRNTIRRVLSDSGRYLHPERRGYRLIKGRPSRVLTESMKQGIEQMLVEDKAKARSKRRTSRQLYLEATRELGYQGAESTLRRYIGTLRPRLNRVWIPLEFSPGEAAQVDWTEWTVEIADRVETIHLFCYRLCYSRAIWVQAYWSENRESLLDGLCNAFSYTGGTTRRLIFDNLKTAVHSGAGKKATEQREFTAFRLYYGITADFCNAGEAHEKGQVEHVAKVAKRELVSGLNRVSSIGELNELLAERCRHYLERRVPDGEETVAERLQAERKVLRALPEHQWECCCRTYVKVNTSCPGAVSDQSIFSAVASCGQASIGQGIS